MFGDCGAGVGDEGRVVGLKAQGLVGWGDVGRYFEQIVRRGKSAVFSFGKYKTIIS